MEAFSDGVLAIVITIMVLEMRAPQGPDLVALWPLTPVFLSYLLSFLFLGIYWNNHHHLFQVVEKVDGRVLWANLHLLFWLSLIPFVTAWMGRNEFAPWPVAIYGVALVMAAVAFFILTRALLALHAPDSTLARALGRDFKGKVSVALYVAAVPLAFVSVWLALALFVVVALIWIVPDTRIERTIAK